MPTLPHVDGLHSNLPTVLNDKASWSVDESPGEVPCPWEVENRSQISLMAIYYWTRMPASLTHQCVRLTEWYPRSKCDSK